MKLFAKRPQVSMLALALALGAAQAEDTRAPAVDAPVPFTIDLPAPPDLTETIAEDLRAEGGQQKAEPKPADALIALDIPSAPDLAEIIHRDLMALGREVVIADAPKPEATPTQKAEQAVRTAPVPSAPVVVAIIERPAEPDIRLDLPLPEPFVSFERMENAPVVAEAQAATPDPVVTQQSAEIAKASERLIQLDIPAPPDVVAIITVPQPADALFTAPLSMGRAMLTLDEARLRALIEPHRARLKLRPTQIESFVAAYSARDWKAFWIDEAGAIVPAAAALRATLQDAEADGLNAERLLAVLPTPNTGGIEEDQRASVDVAHSLAAWLYAHDARGGRIDPRSLSALLTPKLDLPQPADVLAALDSGAAETVLRAYQPRHAGFVALRQELARLRAEQETLMTSSVAGGGSDRPAGLPARFMGDAPLTLGQADPRVPQMRARLRLPASDDTRYTGDLVEAVKVFQRANELTPNGRITPRTRAALDDPRAPVTESEKRPDTESRIGTVIANMERWRWLPQDLGETHIFVNIPDFRMEMLRSGERVFETRVIVGKPETQTPVFSDEMEFLVVNPSWTVPPTILKKEFLPKLAADPEYAARRGFEVIRRGNNITVRQPPGDRNALGHIKFMFPNDHAVYLHDTPTRHLFASQTRAYSHGCVRVEGPFRLAEAMLARQGLDEKALRGMLGRGERSIRLTQKFPVHLAYFTLSLDQNGGLKSKPDIYGHDARIRRALAL